MARAASRRRPPVALTIAASDSGGGAGIQADLATFAAHGVFGATVLTAGTAQNTRGVLAIEPFPAAFVLRQMDAVFPDLRPDAVKIGMLFDAARARAVGTGLRRHRARRVVLDPVLVAKGGEALYARGAIKALVALFELCDLVTPNLPEAEALAGIPIRDESDRRLAAGILADAGARAVLVKGGHGRGAVVSDLYFDGRRFREIRHPRIRTRATHGTGCTLSAAIAANLALGAAMEEAVERAIRYLERALRNGVFPGKGLGTPDRIYSQ
ncbi:MAG TPA: bifunctional hydroxymethylpyrimidine kinase/phosphomethylpyrimidine kinase [Thermoanaerobaculia bacterium]